MMLHVNISRMEPFLKFSLLFECFSIVQTAQISEAMASFYRELNALKDSHLSKMDKVGKLGQNSCG